MKEHAEEGRRGGIPAPDSQLWFNKQVSCINDPFGDVVAPKPDVSQMVDYEAEMGVVIGKTCRHVSIKDARTVIGGYLVVNAGSVALLVLPPPWRRHGDFSS